MNTINSPNPIPPAMRLRRRESAPNIASTLRSSVNTNSAGNAPDRNCMASVLTRSFVKSPPEIIARPSGMPSPVVVLTVGATSSTSSR